MAPREAQCSAAAARWRWRRLAAPSEWPEVMVTQRLSYPSRGRRKGEAVKNEKEVIGRFMTCDVDRKERKREKERERKKNYIQHHILISVLHPILCTLLSSLSYLRSNEN